MKKLTALALCAAMATSMLCATTVFANDSGIEGRGRPSGKEDRRSAWNYR